MLRTLSIVVAAFIFATLLLNVFVASNAMRALGRSSTTVGVAYAELPVRSQPVPESVPEVPRARVHIRAHVRTRHKQLAVLLRGTTRGSYFWDTGGSGGGDTGPPASGRLMHPGCFASPSWPLGTRGYVEYHGRRAEFDICDRGPGAPSHAGIMLDIDGATYAKLTGGRWLVPNVVGGNGQAGNIPVTYCVTRWGSGPGRGAPVPFM